MVDDCQSYNIPVKELKLVVLRCMAVLYTIITTCKLNGINPEDYPKDVLMTLSIRPADADVTDLLPVNWYKKNNGGADPILTPLYPSKN